MGYPYPPPVPAPLPLGRVQKVRVAETLFGLVLVGYLVDGIHYTKDELIAAIDLGFGFYVLEGGVPVALEVVTTFDGSRYVRTMPDGIYDNNLLSLPRF